MTIARGSTQWRLRTACLTIGILLCSASTAIDRSNNAAVINSRFSSIQKLLFESSAATNIAESSNPQATELREAAERHFDRAREYRDAGDYAAAEAELSESIRSMQNAVRALDDASGSQSKKLHDYELRRRSVEALLAAHRHISQEKGTTQQHVELAANVESQLAVSDDLARAGQIGAARTTLDSSYQQVREAVESLRDGDTLVRELNFESEEEEYLYELDRNDTHRMLVQVLLAERMNDERIRSIAEEFIGRSQDLRDQAKEAAANKRFPAGIDLLERSTAELIRAIRSAGVYIPG